MGRLVQAARLERVVIRGGPLESAVGGATTVPVGGDTYFDRIGKYIPGEVIAAYMALDRTLVPDARSFTDALKQYPVLARSGSESVALLSNPAALRAFHLLLPFLALAIGLIFTPLYIRQLAHSGGPPGPWQTQAVISTVAFLIWAYAIQGSAFTVGLGEGLYAGNWASAMLIVFTLVSGIFGPAPVGPDHSTSR
jgi:hypothetical protein